MPRAGITQLAAFQVTITGRFWVTAEEWSEGVRRAVVEEALPAI
jgi:hypothetical protein